LTRNGSGFSVREVIATARRVTGRPIPEVAAARRPGDPAMLVASADRARIALGWKPARADLASIIEDAWRFELLKDSELAASADLVQG
jgi:UDP-glucose 4-epimerase